MLLFDAFLGHGLQRRTTRAEDLPTFPCWTAGCCLTSGARRISAATHNVRTRLVHEWWDLAKKDGMSTYRDMMTHVEATSIGCPTIGPELANMCRVVFERGLDNLGLIH